MYVHQAYPGNMLMNMLAYVATCLPSSLLAGMQVHGWSRNLSWRLTNSALPSSKGVTKKARIPAGEPSPAIHCSFGSVLTNKPEVRSVCNFIAGQPHCCHPQLCWASSQKISTAEPAPYIEGGGREVREPSPEDPAIPPTQLYAILS